MIGKPQTYIVTGIVIYTICNLLYDVFGINGVWYIGNSLAFVSYAYAIYLLLPSFITRLLLILTIGQLSDELIGNPLEISLFEYIAPLIFILYKIHKKVRHGK